MIVERCQVGCRCDHRVWVTIDGGQRLEACGEPAVLTVQTWSGREEDLCADHAEEVAEDLREILDQIEQEE